MIRVVGVLASLLVGCGPQAAVMPKYQADCLIIYTDNNFDPVKLTRNVQLAKKILAYMPLNDGPEPTYPKGDPLIPIARFCAAFEFQQIIIRPEDSWSCQGSPTGKCSGTSWSNNSIEIDRATGSLVHELMHTYERLTGQTDVLDQHKDWLINGRYDLDYIYNEFYETLE